jgi:hypothetical protein
MKKAKDLLIKYDDFSAVLKELEKYTTVFFKKLAKDMPTSFQMDDFQNQYIFVPSAVETKISELSELLWNSFQRGASEVDSVHDENFVNEQIEYFRSKFGNVNSIAHEFEYDRQYGWYDLDNPMESFVKLGKAAQLKIVQEGFLEIAISNYEESKIVIGKRIEDENHKQHALWKEQREKAKVISQLKKQAIELDKNKCVVCGGGARARFIHIGKEPIIENFFQSCSKHERSFMRSQMKFGRFEHQS